MDTAIVAVLISVGSGVILTIIGYLLSQKDKAQEISIADLYEKHKIDAQELIDLRLLVAKKYYDIESVDKIMSSFKSYLDERFDRVERAIKKE